MHCQRHAYARRWWPEPATIPSGKRAREEHLGEPVDHFDDGENDLAISEAIKPVLDEPVDHFEDIREETRALIAEHPELEEFFTQRLDKIFKDYDIFALADLRSDLERTRDFYETTDWELERLIDKLEISSTEKDSAGDDMECDSSSKYHHLVVLRNQTSPRVYGGIFASASIDSFMIGDQEIVVNQTAGFERAGDDDVYSLVLVDTLG